jgi:hypothetical protein
MTVAAHDDVDRWPPGADMADDVAQHQGHLGTVRGLARAQDDRHRLAGRGFIDVDGLEAAAVMMRVEHGKLLLAVGPVLGVVDVEHDAPGHLFEAVAEQLDHRRHHALERDRTGQVLKPRHGRLGTQIGPRLRQPADRHLEGWIGFQPITVIAVGIARRDQQGAVADHFGERMPHPFRRARVFDTRRRPVGNPHPLLDRREQQYPSLRGHLAAVESRVHRLARFVHGGRELRSLPLIRSEKPNHTRIRWLMSFPPAPLPDLANYPG